MRTSSIAGLMGGGVVLGVTALYVTIHSAQGDGFSSESGPWAAALLTVGVVGVVSSFLRAERPRLVVFASCALVTLVIGVLALFSIGGLLVVAAILFASAAWDARADGS